MWYLVLLACCVGWAGGHPICLDNSAPNPSRAQPSFCPATQFGGGSPIEFGSCCKDNDEADIHTKFEALELSEDCAPFHKEVMCGPCHSYAGHLYERLGDDLGEEDGMTLTAEFCAEYFDKCSGSIDFPSYDGLSYCEKHVGSGNEFWSYPYEEAEFSGDNLVEYFPDLSGNDIPVQAIMMHMTPDESEYWIAGQRGDIFKVDASSTGSSSLVIDISDRTKQDFLYSDYQGLQDFCFDPEFSSNGFFYMSYTVYEEEFEGSYPVYPGGYVNRLSKYKYHEGIPAETLASEEVLLDQEPIALAAHNGLSVMFKPSAYGQGNAFNDLYWSSGDGGPQTDPYDHAQDETLLIGSVLRISVSSTEENVGYEIPPGNYRDLNPENPLWKSIPPEICAIGFRNAFRCSFDRETDELYCGDVGQARVETISIVECGKNYGWATFEGSECFRETCTQEERDAVTPAIFEYCHIGVSIPVSENTGGKDICGDGEIQGNSITGGVVYRGSYYKDVLYGAYIFSDHTRGYVYYVKKGEDGVWVGGTIKRGGAPIVAFAEVQGGEVIMISGPGLTDPRTIYHLPCGELCHSTCLSQFPESSSLELTSVGCFWDDGSNLLPTRAPECDWTEALMTPEVCASYCKTLGVMAYAGVRNRNECFCGGAGDFTPVNSGFCTSPCTSNPSFTCGGPSSTEVFAIPPYRSGVTPFWLDTYYRDSDSRSPDYFSLDQQYGTPTALAEEGEITDGTKSVQLASNPDVQYDFFFKAWDEVYGDYTVSITAQLGEGSIGANWKLEIYDFADGGSEPWVSVGDLSGASTDAWTTIEYVVPTGSPEDFVRPSANLDIWVRLIFDESGAQASGTEVYVYVDHVVVYTGGSASTPAPVVPSTPAPSTLAPAVSPTLAPDAPPTYPKGVTPFWLDTYYRDSDSRYPGYFSLDQQYGTPTALAEEGEVTDVTKSVQLASNPNVQYDFFFDPPVEFSGDFTISITAQLGQDSSWDEWKVEMRDFVGRSWVSVGDLSEDLSDVSSGEWTTTRFIVPTDSPENLVRTQEPRDSWVRVYSDVSGSTVYIDQMVISKMAPTPVSADCAAKRNVAGSDVVLLMGQSNMSGYGQGYDARYDGPNNPRIRQWSRQNTIVTAEEHLQHYDYGIGGTAVGMGTAFGRAYVETLPAQRDVLLVPTAYGGTGLIDDAWSPGRNGWCFEDAVKRMAAALASNEAGENCVAAILWHQGENDAYGKRATQEQYRLAWTDMINALRTQVPAAAQAPVILGEFTPQWVASTQGIADPVMAAIRAMPESVSFTAVASADGLAVNSGDIIHFSAAGMREYGQRYFDRLGDAVGNED